MLVSCSSGSGRSNSMNMEAAGTAAGIATTMKTITTTVMYKNRNIEYRNTGTTSRVRITRRPFYQ